MAMISEKINVKGSFLQQWMKYVPASIEYGEKSSKRSIQLILADMNDTGGQNILHEKHLVHLAIWKLINSVFMFLSKADSKVNSDFFNPNG